MYDWLIRPAFLTVASNTTVSVNFVPVAMCAMKIAMNTIAAPSYARLWAKLKHMFTVFASKMMTVVNIEFFDISSACSGIRVTIHSCRRRFSYYELNSCVFFFGEFVKETRKSIENGRRKSEAERAILEASGTAQTKPYSHSATFIHKHAFFDDAKQHIAISQHK